MAGVVTVNKNEEIFFRGQVPFPFNCRGYVAAHRDQSGRDDMAESAAEPVMRVRRQVGEKNGGFVTVLGQDRLNGHGIFRKIVPHA